ncbi:UNVERIFIED_CONTAM: hypothetical protein FKN15_071919 [Acipenser sinensis]
MLPQRAGGIPMGGCNAPFPCCGTGQDEVLVSVCNHGYPDSPNPHCAARPNRRWSSSEESSDGDEPLQRILNKDQTVERHILAMLHSMQVQEQHNTAVLQSLNNDQIMQSTLLQKPDDVEFLPLEGMPSLDALGDSVTNPGSGSEEGNESVRWGSLPVKERYILTGYDSAKYSTVSSIPDSA